jgi:hypothetical protein
MIRAVLAVGLRPLALAVVTTLSLPVRADTPELEALRLGAGQPAEAGGYAGAIALCVAANGKTQEAGQLFAEAGWTLQREDPLLPGLTFAGPQGDLTAQISRGSGSCSVTSTALGTKAALVHLMTVLGATGAEPKTRAGRMGCEGHRVSLTLTATVLSASSDSACENDTSSVVILHRPGS